MADLNKANRQCCDLDIRDYKTNEPWMFADFCNTTTAGFSGDSKYAMRKGAKAIAFHDPIEGTMGIEFQCHPMKVYALLSDGVIETTAILPERKVIKATTAGTLALEDTPISGTVFVYLKDDIGGKNIEGTFATGTFTSTTAEDITVDKEYTICYLVEKTTGVKRISFNNKKIPKAYRVTMETVDKAEDDTLVPFKITAYKATPNRNLDLSFSSEGDPASIKIDFDVLEDCNGNVLDMVEITEE